jgi:predicted metal-binding membrane protein
MRRAIPEDWSFIGVIAVLFALSTAVTILWCGAMASMPGMEMPGGWTMSMAWMRMPGQSWPRAAAAFAGMWGVMMVAMMLPVLAPKLMEYRVALRSVDSAHRNRLAMQFALAYFGVWMLAGVALYPLGLLLNAAAMELPAMSRAVPWIAGISVIVAGALQFTNWKTRELDCCRVTFGSRQSLPGTTKAGTAQAWRQGMTLGAHCVQCCAGPTALLLVLGVMDLRAMALVTALIAIERLAPAAQRVARGLGALLIGTGLWMLITAAPALLSLTRD